MSGKPKEEKELSKEDTEKLLVDIYEYKLGIKEMWKDKSNRQANFEKEAEKYIRPFFEPSDFSAEISPEILVEAYIVHKLMELKGQSLTRLEGAQNRSGESIKNKASFDNYRQNIQYKTFNFKDQLAYKSTLDNLRGAVVMVVKLLNHFGIKTEISVDKNHKAKLSSETEKQVSKIAGSLNAARSIDTRDKNFEELEKWAWEGEKKAEKPTVKTESRYSALDELLKQTEEESLEKWARVNSTKPQHTDVKKEEYKELDELLRRNNPFDYMEPIKHAPGAPNPVEGDLPKRPRRPAPPPPSQSK